ncbi:hypothetical protein Pint_20146 [Pistacia integerrima]|uniref:Uncharacterized protein n=1 Tax=Pistacia integerrima TaxID=434235 RepID=A0ACC0XAA8_9ROSI|nr:hypothetical protein Pint_20146 [Pistacia integerrima]
MNSLFTPFSMVSSCSGFFRFVLFVSVVFTIGCASSAPLCPLQSDMFRNSLQSQCSVGISPNPPIQVYGEFLDGEILDRALSSKQRDAYTSVLFYASWCPFSRSMHPTFEVLSSMFPQMEHFAIEQSSALPSVFSRYGIHSLPSILLVNQTSKLRYRGPKDLHSLVQFYQKTTGLEPVEYFAEDESASLGGSDELIMQVLEQVFTETDDSEQTLLGIFSILPLSEVAYIHIPGSLISSKSFLGFICSSLKLGNIWNFREGAKNARVWASLASVSLGESSSSRSSS